MIGILAAVAPRKRDIERVGPRTRIAGRDLRLGDLVLFKRDDGVECLAQVSGAYTVGQQWHLRLEPPPGVPPARRWLPQSTKLRTVRQVWGKGR